MPVVVFGTQVRRSVKKRTPAPRLANAMVQSRWEMRSTLDHLPAEKREQLAQITKIYLDCAPIEMLILFGSHARGDWVEDFEQRYFSDYDLLAVVHEPAQARRLSLWSQLQAAARELTGHVPVNTIVHHIKELNDEIRLGRYFFTDILRDGIALYDSRMVNLATPKTLTAEERFREAESDFRYWFESARGFWVGVRYYLAGGRDAHAAFSLHQAAERLLHATHLAFTAYKTKTHDLEWLANRAAPWHPELEGALPRTEPDDEYIVKLLNRAYIESRYSMTFYVTADELTRMRALVLDLAHRVLAAAGDRLRELADDEYEFELPEPFAMDDSLEIPDFPTGNDELALETWRVTVVTKSLERAEALQLTWRREIEERAKEEGRELGRMEGRHEGREIGRREGEGRGREYGRFEGREIGREEGRREGELMGRELGREEGLREGQRIAQTRAILEILTRRGVDLTAPQRERILTCQDDTELTRLADRAWTVTSAADLWPAAELPLPEP